jgi:Family of unknown function (DUF6527)
MKIRVSYENENPVTVAFDCPGCKREHCLNVGKIDHPMWSYSGNPDSPTLIPSVNDRGTPICHFTLIDGIIRFLPDSTHAFANQSMTLPDIAPVKAVVSMAPVVVVTSAIAPPIPTPTVVKPVKTPRIRSTITLPQTSMAKVHKPARLVTRPSYM